MHHISTVENPAVRLEEETEQKSESSKDRWYIDDYDNASDPPDAGEIVDDQSDISDFEETFMKKRKKKVYDWFLKDIIKCQGRKTNFWGFKYNMNDVEDLLFSTFPLIRLEKLESIQKLFFLFILSKKSYDCPKN